MTLPRPDTISAAERDLIDQHIRSHGVTLCPPRTFTEGLVRVGSASEESKAVSRRIQARGRRFANAGKARTPGPETERLIRMAETMTAREIGEAVGLDPKTVSRRLARHKVSAVNPVVRAAENRRERVRVMMAQGFSAREMAATTGVNQQTVYDDIRILEDRGHRRISAKSGKVVHGIEERREVVRKLRAENQSLAKIADHLGISISSVRHDLKMLEAAHA